MTRISLSLVATVYDRRKIEFIAAIAAACLAGSLFADVGGTNPTGTSGQYNGNLEVGVDLLTMNATRSVTDLVIAGGVGSYPLAFTRTMNSRYTVGVGNLPMFGAAGSWTHSYQWTIDAVTVKKTGSVGLPVGYNVNYPDGRRISFSNTGTSDNDFRGSAGVRDRFEELAAGATECYVRLPDGGKIWFHANISTTISAGIYTTVYTFTFKGVIDPYGQTTTITYPADGSLTVTEPAGRTIKIFYKTGPVGDTVVDRVTGSDGRTVTYNYTTYTTANGTRYSSLSSVRYFGDPQWDATYTYQAGNVDPNGRPLIATCMDPMFDGPLWKVAYDFKPSGTNADGSAVVYGQLWRVKHPNGTPVSTLLINQSPGSGWSSRTETRGDGPSRTFTYHGYRLQTATDFKGVTASQGYDSNNYLASVTDRNGNSTGFACNNFNGEIKVINYPNGQQATYDYGGSSCPDPNNQDDYNKYWLYQGADGTTYLRDTSKQVTSATYNYTDPLVSPPPHLGWTETFSYNNFGQILTHVQYTQTPPFPNGPSEVHTYDSAGRVTAYWDYAHPTSGKPTVWYQYDSYGRVSGMTEARGSASGDPNYTTAFQYNGRGQLTRLTHPDGTYIQYSYNPNGTLAWAADERHSGAITDANQRTSYVYDDYKRLISVTTPQRASGDNTPRTTTYNYDTTGSGSGYSRTAALPTKVTSPGGKVVNTLYDENLRTLSVTAVGDANVPSATTSYTYDGNGNVLTVKDPNGQSSSAVTTYTYNVMNKVKSVTDPSSTDRNSNGHTMDYTYDNAGNLTQETRADGVSCTYTYMTNGWLRQGVGYGNDKTIYSRNLFGQPTWVDYYKADGVSHYSYAYGYDGLGRLTTMYYPPDASGASRTENYHYDIANHLDQYMNPAGQAKTLTYDNRGRLTNTSWSANGPTVTIGYDATRPSSITSSQNGITTTIGFGYDEANNRTSEDQGITGMPTRHVQTDPDADGNRTDLLVKTGSTINFANYFDYTSRNELLNIYDNSHAAFFKYSYDASGNVTQRLGQRLHDTTTLTYDALNRPITCAQNGLNGANFATSHYVYSKVGNLTNTTRDEEGGKGDYFTYDNLNQATTALYSATGPSDSNPAKKVSYTLGIRNRSSMTVTDNILGTNTTTSYDNNTNDLNQLTSVTVNGVAQSVGWENNLNLSSYNGWTYSYDAENRLMSVSGNGHSAAFVYDGLGRCVKRVLDGATTIFTYDQWTPIVEWDGSGNLVASNVYGLGDDEIVYRSGGSTQLFYKSDPMGNVKFLLDQNGTGIEKYKYDAFGSPTITDWSGNARTNSTCGNRFMFSGREYFSALGLYDMRNRVYDPTMGRFYQTDLIGFAGDSWNLYRFCGNNPLLGGDTIGLQESDPFSDDTSGSDGPQYEFTFYSGLSYGGFWNDSGSGSDLSSIWGGDSLGSSSTPWTVYATDALRYVDPSVVYKLRQLNGALLAAKIVFRVMTPGNMDDMIRSEDAFWGMVLPPGMTVGESSQDTVNSLRASLTTPEGQGALLSSFALAVVGGKLAVGKMPVVPELVARDLPVVVIRAGDHPAWAENIWHAQQAGHPTELSHGFGRAFAQAQRGVALKGVPSIAGLTRDEYPFASSLEGGAGSWVGHIPASENSAGGGILSRVIRLYSMKPGDRYRVVVMGYKE
jgi:RHS repeat-associated protein